MNPDQEARFWAKVNKTPTCWLWTGACCSGGYGQFRIGGTTRKAHRISLEHFLGRPLAPGMFACHAPHDVCGHRNCVNPAHLSEKTVAENNADKFVDGTMTRGTRHPRCKLTEQQVLAIRSDTRLIREIAAEYGIGKRAVSYIRSRATWHWLEDGPEASASLE